MVNRFKRILLKYMFLVLGLVSCVGMSSATVRGQSPKQPAPPAVIVQDGISANQKVEIVEIVDGPIIMPTSYEATPASPSRWDIGANLEPGKGIFQRAVHRSAPSPSNVDTNVVPVSGCSSCSSGLLGSAGHSGGLGGLFHRGGHGVHDGGCASGGCGSGLCPGDSVGGQFGCHSTNCGSCCVPGRTDCCSFCGSDRPLSKLCCGLYHCLCCQDPCYEPRWIGVANSSFWVDSARPVTHTRLRYQGLFEVTRPDRAEYYLARMDGAGKGPAGPVQSAEFNEFYLYNEVAAGGFAFFADVPYRAVSYDPIAAIGDPGGHSGFGDISLGTKSVLMDCELLIITFQFTTFIPTASAGNGLGVGHVALEPALLTSLKLSPDAYLQYGSVLRIPIAGDSEYAGLVWSNRFSLNKIIYRFLPDVQLIGNLEMIQWSVLDGAYTAIGPAGPIPMNGSDTFFSIGPGLRLNICNHVDFGAGSMFSLTDTHFEQVGVRAEFRWRF